VPLWFWLGLLIGSAMTESPPLVPRLAMLVPPAALLAGAALGQGMDKVPLQHRGLIGAGAAIALTAVLFVPNYQNYFEKYQERDVYWPWIEPQRAIGAYAAALPDGTAVYLLQTPGVWAGHPTLDFTRRTGRGSDVMIREVPGWESPEFDATVAFRDVPRSRVRIIAPVEALAGLSELQELCPNGLIYEQHGPMGLGGDTSLQFKVLVLAEPNCLLPWGA
jgi:hypothetical protein